MIAIRTSFKLGVLCSLLVANGSFSSSQIQSPATQAPQSQERKEEKSVGGMRRAPFSFAPLMILLAAMNNPKQTSRSESEAAAIPSLSQLKVKNKIESRILQSIREGREANLESEKDRHLNADFVNTLLFRTAASAVPNKLISIRAAIIEGEVSVPRGSSPVPNNIVFNRCTFQGPVTLSGGRFEQSLIFIDSEFSQGLRLDLAEVKGDVFLVRGSASGVQDAIQVLMTRAQIDGQLQILGLSAKSIVAEGLKAKNVLIALGDDWTESILLPQIESESLTLSHQGHNPEGRVGTLNVEQGSLSSDLWLQSSIIGYIDAKGLRVTGAAAFDPHLSVDQQLDLSNARLGALLWSIPSSSSGTKKCDPILQRSSGPGWPCEILASGLTFDDLTVTGEGNKSDLNNDFLEQASSSESAFLTYEQILRNRGDLTQADSVYSSMRAKRRSELWRTSRGNFRRRVAGTIQIILDKAQSIFLGYGRFPEPPLLWSLGFVTLGTLLFERTRRMEQTKDAAEGTQYSRFWYSLELFLPVVELGMAKNWRPTRSALRTYARLHQLAGWILVPASLAALTGAIK